MKIVINVCYGGFEVPDEVAKSLKHGCRRDERMIRTDPILIEWVESNPGKKFDCTQLKVVEIPDDVDWVIEEYDGIEWVAEKHRIWR